MGRGSTTRGLTYTVNYLDVEPTVTQLQDAPPPSQDIVSAYTQLPDFLPASILRTAKKVTAKATTEYDKAAALQAWFRTGGGFIYDTNVVTKSNVDAVSSFLASKHGYCVQFSSAMAVMARLLGIPARIGVGFLPGTHQSNGTNTVSLNDAHAWPELYFEGVGWVRFEPTPAVRSGAAPSYSQPTVVPAPGSSTSASATAPTAKPSTNAGVKGDIGGASAKKSAEREHPGPDRLARAGQGLGPDRAGPDRRAGHPRRRAHGPSPPAATGPRCRRPGPRPRGPSCSNGSATSA